MTEITDEAIAAARDTFDKARLAANSPDFCWRLALASAAPLITSHRETATAQVIARAERERIRQLAAEHDAKAAKCSAGVAPQPSRPCACRTANPAFPFADLLTEG